MGNAQPGVVCTDGAADVRMERWGGRPCISFHADKMGLDGHAIYYTEDSLSGRVCDSTYIDNGISVPIIRIQNDIAVVETIALTRAFWCLANWVRLSIVPIIVSDRVGSLRNLENSNGRQISSEQSSCKTYRYALAYSLRLLRTEIIRTLCVHNTIRVFITQREDLMIAGDPIH